MLTSLTLPALAFLIGIPGLGLLKHHRVAATPDTLPLPWKPATALALQDQFVFAGLPELRRQPWGIKLTYDPRHLAVSIDPDSGLLRTAVDYGRRNFTRLWEERTRSSVNTLAGSGSSSAPKAGGLSFQFPSPLPPKI